MAEQGFFPRVAPEGVAAHIMLAFLGTAGLFYVNIMPALVSGLVEGLGFSNREAGLVGSANVYGAALGALCAVFLVKRVPWRASCAILFCALIGVDVASIMLENPKFLMGLRFVHGCIGGMSVGIAFSVLARTAEADKSFGYLLVVQYALGGLGIMLLPPLVPEYGTWVLFATLISFTVVTLLMMPFLPEYPVKEHVAAEPVNGSEGIQVKPLIFTLLALFLFQAANMGLFAYMIGMGKYYGLEGGFIGLWLGVASWAGVLGSMLVIYLSTRYGRMKPLVAGVFVTVLCTIVLHYSGLPWVYALANAGVGVTWAFVIPYLFGMCSEFDKAGQMAALGGFASKMGLASGPAVAALLITGDNYALIINAATVVLVACMVVLVMPARLLDQQAA